MILAYYPQKLFIKFYSPCGYKHVKDRLLVTFIFIFIDINKYIMIYSGLFAISMFLHCIMF